MKKIFSVLIALAILSSYVCYGEGNENSIKYLKSAEPYDYGSEYVWLAADEAGIIPLSLVPYDGYAYAYAPSSGEIKIEKVSPPKFTDCGDGYIDGLPNDVYYVDMYLDEISARGVMVGYGDGTFCPAQYMTRAEMAAVFAGLFRVEPSEEKSCFTDVPDDHWCRGNIMALVNMGVLMRDESFNPDEEVTREQLTAMTYRMLKYIGLEGESGEFDFTAYSDLSSLDWSKEAYNNLLLNGYRTLMRTDYGDDMIMDDDTYTLEPAREVTRYECAEFLYLFIVDFFQNNAPAIKRDTAPEEEIPILDGSTSTYEITRNIYWQYYLNHENAPSFPKAHSKTSNSYKRLIDGEVDMIFVPDPSEDIKKYAEEKGVALKYIPIANEALVFFNDESNTVNNITTEQLHNIYVDNSVKNWSEIGGDNSELVPFCRNLDSGSHAQMEKFILGGGELNDAIRREHTSWIMSSILTEVDSFNKNNTGKSAMGYTLYYYYFANQMLLGPVNLKLMSIDGVEPTEETIADGTYPYTTNYYAVIRDGENGKAEQFARLMQGEFGDMIIKMSGMGVIKR